MPPREEFCISPASSQPSKFRLRIADCGFEKSRGRNPQSAIRIPQFFMLVSDFDYDLPERLIAQEPVERRDRSRLLVVDRASGTFKDSVFDALPEYLRPGDLLVLNNTRVFP